ncbi:TPA: hypothetical protein EYN98_14900 [Candidatus Poribacteria bacterium]|nr:hypothetical protein [Candidatus Poribacteria bacterium]HIB86656.1 hypothetical protein [Candidatus Poribacteria bacterium]HIO10022.1 hypothetical protein [Candidatus Poribacteria bacterium]HIP10610.1 hypothetical protein [Rhodospirillales bacterium]
MSMPSTANASHLCAFLLHGHSKSRTINSTCATQAAVSRPTGGRQYLLTNMSPQVPNLNRGMWRILEEQIRKWALKEQELYIITGPIIRPNYKTIGPNKVNGTIRSFSITTNLKLRHRLL